jgi:hypothetical protein
MSEAAQAKSAAVPPEAQLVQMATAFWVSRLLYLAAELKLADLLGEGPRTAEELAQATETHGPSLYRVMRTLASLGLFKEDASRHFSLTALGEALRSGAPGSARASVLTLAGPLLARPLDDLLYSVQTGKPGFDKVFGTGAFDWLANHPEEASMFSETMIGFHGMERAAVASAYDFSEFETILDVGGATGNLLAAILGKHRKPHGVLFDMPHVVRDAPALLRDRGLADRVRIEAGSFFDSIPGGADAYLLSHVIHDWSEDQCLAILGNCRVAMKPGARLLIIEMVLPPGDTPHPGKMLDIIMLSVPGGQERTEAEYRVLLDKAGFRLARVVPTESAVSIVEAFPQPS